MVCSRGQFVLEPFHRCCLPFPYSPRLPHSSLRSCGPSSRKGFPRGMNLYMFETPRFEAGTELAICDSSCVRRTHEIKMHPAVAAVSMRFRPYCSTVVISRRAGYCRYSFLCSVRNASPSAGGVAKPLFLQPWHSKQKIPSSPRMKEFLLSSDSCRLSVERKNYFSRICPSQALPGGLPVGSGKKPRTSLSHTALCKLKGRGVH